MSRTRSTAELLAQSKDGSHVVVPVFGPRSYGSTDPVPVRHDPRMKGDPYPWERWGMRYRCSELTLVEVKEETQASRIIQSLMPGVRRG